MGQLEPSATEETRADCTACPGVLHLSRVKAKIRTRLCIAPKEPNRGDSGFEAAEWGPRGWSNQREGRNHGSAWGQESEARGEAANPGRTLSGELPPGSCLQRQKTLRGWPRAHLAQAQAAGVRSWTCATTIAAAMGQEYGRLCPTWQWLHACPPSPWCTWPRPLGARIWGFWVLKVRTIACSWKIRCSSDLRNDLGLTFSQSQCPIGGKRDLYTTRK